VDHALAIKRPAGDVSEEDLNAADFVTRGYLHSKATFLGRQRKSTVIAHHVEGAIQLILTSKFVGVLPDHIAKPWVNMGKMVRLQVPTAVVETPLCVVLREKSASIPAISALVEDLALAYEEIDPTTQSPGLQPSDFALPVDML
jgi:DNA-binding transcriptional LysR family regulator